MPDDRLVMRAGPLRFNAKGEALVLALPRRIELMEAVTDDFWMSLRGLTVPQLKAVHPTGPFVGLFDALIAMRSLMGGEGSV